MWGGGRSKAPLARLVMKDSKNEGAREGSVCAQKKIQKDRRIGVIEKDRFPMKF